MNALRLHERGQDSVVEVSTAKNLGDHVWLLLIGLPEVQLVAQPDFSVQWLQSGDLSSFKEALIDDEV